MKINREIILGCFIFLALAVSVTSLFPTLDDLFIENSQWNGLSEFYVEIKPIRVHSSSQIRVLESNSTLFIVGPSRSFSENEISAVKTYLESGGRVVLADDFGTGNQLLTGLGVETRFSGELLRDSVFYKSIPELPRLLNFTTFDVNEIVLNYATFLVVGDALQVLESSSPLSYIENEEGIIVPSSYPILGRISYGAGKLYVLADSSVFINTMIDESYNRVLLDELVNGQAYVDTFYSIPTRLISVKWMIRDVYSTFSRSEVLYGVVILFSFLVYRVKLGETDEVRVDEVGELLKRHMDWDREQITWLQMQRRKHSGNQ